MTTTTCPPLADRITKSLLGYGVIAGPIYIAAVAAQAATPDTIRRGTPPASSPTVTSAAFRSRPS